MKLKKEYLILILIIAALAAYLLMRSFDRTHYQLPEIARLDPGGITRIEISQKADSIVLQKKDNQWHLEPAGYLADTNRVETMLKVLETFSLTALISEAKDYSRYDLDAEKRIGVRAWLGDALQRSFDIGKAAPSFRHTFVRLEGDDRVFHASDNFRSKFDLTADSLRDKNVLAFNAADIQEIQIAADQASLKLVRSEVPVGAEASPPEKADAAPPPAVKFEWKSSDGKEGNHPNINRLLTILSSLKCADYINDRRKDSFSAPIYVVRLKGIQQYQLDIFAKLQKDAENYPALSSTTDDPFFLSESQVQQIMKDPDEFLEKEGNKKKEADFN